VKGKFLTIEGVEGVGKSTNLESIKQILESESINFIATREPGGTLIAEKIRTLLLEHHQEKLCELSELLLVFAARAQHIEVVIKPALEAGTWVLCDRFTDATYAYQGGGRGLNSNTISELENLTQGTLRPDFTLILDLDPEIGLSRAKNRGELDRIELEKTDFFKKVRASYLDIAKREPERCKVVDASRSIEVVSNDVTEYLMTFIREST
jgi:dTMP kinase|tara:strand:+ start:664 stop:1293 length:630 start_codon:yes stop_codon:yes gene_type:complete